MAQGRGTEVEIVAEHEEDEEEHRFELDTDEIPSGWTTITFDNRTDHTHTVQLAELPRDAIDAAEEEGEDLLDFYVEHVIGPFQWLMDDIDPEKEPDPDDLSDRYSDPEEGVIFPPWLEEVLPSGGAGLTSGHTTSMTTVQVGPGEYIAECYVKDDEGEFHSYQGMVEQITVTDDRAGEEPEATLDLSLSSDGIDVPGDVRPGQHTVAVHFQDQRVYDHQLGHDVHLVRLDEDTSVDDVSGWMNWMDPAQFVSDGTEPGAFLGGVQDVFTPDLLEGAGPETAYFHVNLNPGAYAWVAEVPDPAGSGLLETFSVAFDEEAQIDPVFGYPTTDAANVPSDLQPDHEVNMLVAPPAGPGQPPFLYFDPVGIQVNPGDVVQFNAVSPDHTVTAYHPGIGPDRRVPEGVPPFSSPVLGPGAAWLYRFEQEGVYDVNCAPHHVFGMVMRLVVGDLAEGDLPEYARTVEGLPSKEDIETGLNQLSEQNEDCEWPFLMPAGVLGTDAVDPMHIQEAAQVPFADVAEELGYELSPPGEGATVRVHNHPDLGRILVGPNGMTLYMFDNDTQGEGESACYDTCAENWPPLTVEGEPSAGEGVQADLTTFEREDGATQVAANGWPLYHFAQDEAPGDASGQGVQGVWWVLGPDGAPIRNG